MIISALMENSPETRVAITPNAVKHYQKLGFEVICEENAGLASGFSNEAYLKEGAQIAQTRQSLLNKTDVLVCINEPPASILNELPANTLIIGHITPSNKNLMDYCCKHPLSLFSMNLIPRISRAQSMDSLSSQANLAGYAAVLVATHHFNRVIPMMMTAAGMIPPAKILVLGAGVAGLQAIATARRLGGVVYAFDVRKAAKEQVESLGAEFICVDEEKNHETKGGYATEMSDAYKALQSELIQEYAALADIVISTALIPGKPAPRLLTQQMVDNMKPGSVIVDLATSAGGNCEVSQANQIITYKQITVIGTTNLAGHVSATASELYSGNVVNLLRLLVSSNGLTFNKEDDIIKQALLCYEGQHLPFHAN